MVIVDDGDGGIVVCDSVMIGGGVGLWVLLLSGGGWEGGLRCCGGGA